MKFFVIGLGSRFPEHVRLVEELAKKHDVLYWVRMQGLVAINEAKFLRTIIHDYYDALKGIAAPGIDINTIDPWDPYQIREYADIEAEFLVMMDKWYPAWPVMKRQDFFYDMLRYWGGVLDRFTPDAIVMHTVPHEMYSFILYAIAKRRGIKVVMFDIVLRFDRVVALTDYRLFEPLQQGARDIEGKSTLLDDLPMEMQEYYLELSESRNPAPKNMEVFKGMHTPLRNIWRLRKPFIKFIKDGTLFERVTKKMFMLFKSDAKDEYKKYMQNPDYQKPYIYAPLHYQPECTTSPQGGIFVDQILMIKMLAAAVPAGWEIYVKEHPAQWAISRTVYTPQRYKGFYKEIAQLPNVRIVPVSTNTFVLTDRAKTVATITGTAAWEGILRGKPSLIFGYPYFMHAPGILRVSSVVDCREAFKKIQNGFLPQRGELLSYLNMLYKVSVQGFLTDFGRNFMTSQGDDRWRGMYMEIEKALKRT